MVSTNMNFRINSPSYYTQIHGIDDEIYKICLSLSKNIDVTRYTAELDSIAITPIVAPIEETNDGKWKEVKIVSLSYRYADISLQIDYQKYVFSDLLCKKELLIDNLLKSLLVVKKKLGKRFDYNNIEKDILLAINSAL